MAFSVSLVRLHALLRNKASQTLAIYFAQFSLTRVRRYVHGKGKSPFRTLKEKYRINSEYVPK
ncbi:hypothetical protein phi3T_55 [Bacillus phage phi3T]|nr:hypothetical protein phi3T_55 [Bacillus phage phi3T]